MSKIRYGSDVFPANPGENVLDVLLRNKMDVPYSCRKGVCMSCISRLDEGRPSPRSQENLKKSLVDQGYFLACKADVTGDMSIAAPDDATLYSRARVKVLQKLSGDVIRLVLQPATPLYYHAGQYVTLRRGDGLTRSYSMASVPFLDTALEFHVRQMPDGLMSNWIANDLKEGDDLEFQGPNGSCYYFSDDPQKPMLLIGTGSGLAPLYGIVRDALFSGHKGDIRLYHGSRLDAGLYLKKRLFDLADQHQNFWYQPCVSSGVAPSECKSGRASEVALEELEDLSGWNVYLCGDPGMVKDTQRKAYLAGAATGDIYSDAFEYRDVRQSKSAPYANDRRNHF
ncbi:MAG: 2Fe-2S iron-sulfur cluster binding domain-containing protein [Alphaproteobacteria bacterium]|nr:2Fe-2S iron-sulfur cluster binding domain-containing protein [Alphaproteobacteria bacterium]MBT4085239.1 2Fe-2S iron-sulfur cluster binding domain-containing protein [Alphaproteobacteria bacterium]MBT4544955.1 2Fe-2S iron-sulfur cluster binding domain-containing protein [Alphaproteobacteria bacterium]MBT7746172.1 2Fe-2S iron-sulfur cluster binding domain-containing protein [Alphaproteobacteria bacterium]